MLYQRKGFSLVELMVVIAVSGILMAVAIPTFIGARDRSNTSACVANLQIIKSAIQEWALDHPDDVVLGHEITTGELETYISDGFASLKEPGTGDSIPYLDNGPLDTGADYVVKIIDDPDTVVVGDAFIPDPTCNKNPTDHVLD